MNSYLESLEPLIEELASDIKSSLGERLLGLYLYGSYVRGGFDPDASDLDVLAVTAAEVEGLDLTGLEQMHAEFVRRHPEWNDRLDVIYIGRGTLESFRSNQGSLAVISPGEPFHVTGDVADWLMNWYHVLESGVTLFGPAPAALIPPISWDEFAAAVARYVEWFRSEIATGRGAGYRAYAVLSTCRALYAVRNGKPATKQEAAAWTKERMPEWAWLIDAALRSRLAHGGGFSDERTLIAADAFIDLIAKQVTAPGSERRSSSPGEQPDHHRASTGDAVLDIGGDTGALVLLTGPEFAGEEVEVSPIWNDAARVHTVIRERRLADRVEFAGLFPELPAGEYRIWTSDPALPDRVTVVGGAVSEVDWRRPR